MEENGDVFNTLKPPLSELGKKLSKDKADMEDFDRTITKRIREAARNTIIKE